MNPVIDNGVTRRIIMDGEIKNIHAREILDSRGNPTLEVEIETKCNLKAKASVPSGASTGSKEAVELRDNDKTRYSGKGVLKAVSFVNNEINNTLCGYDVTQQNKIDEIMINLDGTKNKSKLGANSILGVSLASAKLASKVKRIPLYQYISELAEIKNLILPVPCMNVLNGGVHAKWQGADFQEFMIAPWGAKNFREALQHGSEIYHSLKSILSKKGLSVGVGDEGGFAPQVISNRQPIEFIMSAIENTGLKPQKDVVICLDPASSEFYENGQYNLRTENKQLTSFEMTQYYKNLVKDFPIVSIEDGLSENDWDGWKILHQELGQKIELVGDDLFVTNPKYIKKGIEENFANSALIKLNQIGTLSETINAVKLCYSAGWGAFISHRSGETTDTFIADLAVGLAAKHIKTGAPCRGERVAKYNRLLKIEDELGQNAEFARKTAFINANV